MPKGKNIQRTNITQRKKMTRKKKRITAIIVLFAVFLVVDAGVFVHKKIEEKRADGMVQGQLEKNQADKKKIDENGEEVIIRGKTNIYVVNVGLGEAIIVDHGENEVLIDGGPAGASKQVLDALNVCVDGDLEYVINTDCKLNRCGGLPAVYDKFKVDNTIYAREPASADSDKDNQAFDEFYAKAKLKCENVMEGKTANYSLGGSSMLTVMSTTNSDTDNSKKLSCVVSYGGKTLVALGNADSERMTLLSSSIGQADIVIAGQNGGPQSVNKTALDKFNPSFFVISSSSPEDNKGKYPSPDTMQILEESSKNVYSTYHSGTILFSLVSNGEIIASVEDKEDETISVENY